MIIRDIKVFTKGRNGYNAVGIYDPTRFQVKKGSVILNMTAAMVNPIISKLRSDKTIVSAGFCSVEGCQV